jgi:hypothetical protein
VRLPEARAQPGTRQITIVVAKVSGIHVYSVPVPDTINDGQISHHISTFDPNRYQS